MAKRLDRKRAEKQKELDELAAAEEKIAKNASSLVQRRPWQRRKFEDLLQAQPVRPEPSRPRPRLKR